MRKAQNGQHFHLRFIITTVGFPINCCIIAVELWVQAFCEFEMKCEVLATKIDNITHRNGDLIDNWDWGEQFRVVLAMTNDI